MILASVVLAGCVDGPGPEDDEGSAPTPPPDPMIVAFFDALSVGRDIVFVTDHGEIRLLLYDALMPWTAGRFAELVELGFYDGTLVHRVVDDFVIQGGDPSGTGQLGSGETIPFERHEALHYGGGAMGLARDVDPDSGDSQWFITEKPAPHLHDPQGTTGAVFGAYALYAQVYAGLEVVRAIASEPVVPGLDRPVSDVVLEQATAGPPPAIDLLQLPRHVTEATVGPFVLTIERPLHLFEGRPMLVRLYLEAASEDAPAPPPALLIGYSDGQDVAASVVADALPDDAYVFEASIAPPAAGTLVQSVSVPRHGDVTHDVVVTAWHPDLARYDRSTAPMAS